MKRKEKFSMRYRGKIESGEYRLTFQGWPVRIVDWNVRDLLEDGKSVLLGVVVKKYAGEDYEKECVMKFHYDGETTDGFCRHSDDRWLMVEWDEPERAFEDEEEAVKFLKSKGYLIWSPVMTADKTKTDLILEYLDMGFIVSVPERLLKGHVYLCVNDKKDEKNYLTSGFTYTCVEDGEMYGKKIDNPADYFVEIRKPEW